MNVIPILLLSLFFILLDKMLLRSFVCLTAITIHSTVNATFFLTWLGVKENLHSVPYTIIRGSRN